MIWQERVSVVVMLTNLMEYDTVGPTDLESLTIAKSRAFPAVLGIFFCLSERPEQFQLSCQSSISYLEGGLCKLV